MTYLPKESAGTGKKANHLPFVWSQQTLSLRAQEFSCLKSEILPRISVACLANKEEKDACLTFLQ